MADAGARVTKQVHALRQRMVRSLKTVTLLKLTINDWRLGQRRHQGDREAGIEKHCDAQIFDNRIDHRRMYCRDGFCA
jgi:hypothetical protein